MNISETCAGESWGLIIPFIGDLLYTEICYLSVNKQTLIMHLNFKSATYKKWLHIQLNLKQKK